LSLPQKVDQVIAMNKKGLAIVDRAETCLDPPSHGLPMYPEQLGDLPDGVAETFDEPNVVGSSFGLLAPARIGSSA